MTAQNSALPYRAIRDLAIEADERARADAELNRRIDELVASFSDRRTGLERAHARITELLEVFASADEALARRTLEMEAQVNDPNTGLAATIARITEEQTVRATRDEALASSVTTLSAQVNDPGSGLPKAHALIVEEQLARATADTAIASDVTTLSARVDDAESDISGNSTAISSLDARVTTAEGSITSQGSAITSLESRVDDAESDISGNASAITSLDTRVTSAEGSITSQATAITTLESQVQTPTTGLLARVTEIESTYATDAEVAASASTTLSSAMTYTDEQILAAGDGVAVYRQDDAPTGTIATGSLWFDSNDNDKLYRWDGDSWEEVADDRIVANASAISSLDTRVTSAEGTISAHSSALTSLDSRLDSAEGDIDANASAISSLDTRVDTAEGNITANASSITSLTATVGTKARTFRQSTAPTATATGDLWIDSDDGKVYRWSGSAWVDAGVLASALSTLTASVTTEASARAAADGNLAGQYVLQVAAGNVVTGMKVLSTTDPDAGDVSEIIFQTDKFKVYNGTTGVTPFSISGSNIVFEADDIRHGLSRTYTSTSGSWTDNTVSRWSANTAESYGAAVRAVAGLGLNAQFAIYYGTDGGPDVARLDRTGLYVGDDSGSLDCSLTRSAANVWATPDAFQAGEFRVSGNKVVGARGAAVADLSGPLYTPTGTYSSDSSNIAGAFNTIITKINDILARLRASTGHGLIA